MDQTRKTRQPSLLRLERQGMLTSTDVSFFVFHLKKRKKSSKKLTKEIKKFPKSEKLPKTKKITQKIIQKCVVNGHLTVPVNTTRD